MSSSNVALGLRDKSSKSGQDVWLTLAQVPLAYTSWGGAGSSGGGSSGDARSLNRDSGRNGSSNSRGGDGDGLVRHTGRWASELDISGIKDGVEVDCLRGRSWGSIGRRCEGGDEDGGAHCEVAPESGR